MSTQYYVAQSLDGYIAEPDGNLDWLTGYPTEGSGPSGATEGSYDRFYADVGALAMGSGTYEWMLDRSSNWPYAGVPCWVFTSRDLPGFEGADVRFVSAAPADAHGDMAAAAGERNVWLVGGGNLASQFAAEGLLDELILTVVPVCSATACPPSPSAMPTIRCGSRERSRSRAG